MTKKGSTESETRRDFCGDSDMMGLVERAMANEDVKIDPPKFAQTDLVKIPDGEVLITSFDFEGAKAAQSPNSNIVTPDILRARFKSGSNRHPGDFHESLLDE